MALWKFTNLNKYGTLRSRIIYVPDGKPLSVGPGFGPFVGARRFRYQSRSSYYGLFTALNGKKYLTPDWIEVLPETTLNDVFYEKPEEPKQKPEKWTFKSSSGDGEYLVRKSPSGKLHCNCWGYIAHKRCKHVTEVQKKLEKSL